MTIPDRTCCDEGKHDKAEGHHDSPSDPGEGEAQVVEGVANQDAGGRIHHIGHHVDEGEACILRITPSL